MRRGKLKYLPLCSLGPSLNIGMTARTASSKTSRLFSMVIVERLELGDRGALAHAELGPAARQQVEAGDALGDVGGMVGRELQDAVAQPDLLGALAGGRQERGGRGRVGVFLEEVVLDLPGVVVTELVGELELGERILVKPVLVALLPGARQLQLIEDAELHALFLPGRPAQHARKRR